MPRTIQALPQFPEGTGVVAYPLNHQTESERRVGRKPSASPIASGTVDAMGEVTLDHNLSVGRYVLHATVPGTRLETVAGQPRERERYIQFRV